MAVVTMKQLLEAGVHFGHQTRRWNPKMAKYIFTERNDIHVIDLQKTLVLIGTAYKDIRETVSNGGTILFVSTKKQAQEATKEHATRCGMPYVNLRWLGGTLTNFTTIHSRISYLEELERQDREGELEILPKKEALKIRRKIEKLQRNLEGIRTLHALPKMVFVIDPRKERIPVAEARKLGIPIVGIVDTNCDPDEIDYVIPGNDDAIRAASIICRVVADAVIEGKMLWDKKMAEEEALGEPATVGAGAQTTGIPEPPSEVEVEEEVVDTEARREQVVGGEEEEKDVEGTVGQAVEASTEEKKE